MSPRWIGSRRYTYLLTKMRSWSSSEGIMLVPSTFTGWYRKIIMNAEIASEMKRSRSQTESTGKVRGGAGAGVFSWRGRESAGRGCSGILLLLYGGAVRVEMVSRTTIVMRFETPPRIVIPQRGVVARGICCFAAGKKQIPRR